MQPRLVLWEAGVVTYMGFVAEFGKLFMALKQPSLVTIKVSTLVLCSLLLVWQVDLWVNEYCP